MVDIVVRALGTDEWQLYREVRLAALQNAPNAFVARFEDEASAGDDFWQERMIRAPRFVAEREGKPVGVVSLGQHDDDPETAEVFGLWTAQTARGAHAAWNLVAAADRKAAEDGSQVLYFWAGSDNAAAVGFASSFGFRPTSKRRPARRADSASQSDEDEVAMVLPLSADPTQVPNPYMQ